MRVIILLLLLGGLISAQDSIMIKLDTVVIEDRFDLNNDSQTFTEITIAPKDLGKSLSDQLRENSIIDTRVYGTDGAVSSVTVRGMSSSHTNFNWNGFNINSLTLGSFDFGRESAFLGDEITLNLTPNSTSEGNGAIGGSINLTSLPHYNKGWSTIYGMNFSKYNRRFSDYDSLKMNQNYMVSNSWSNNNLYFHLGVDYTNASNIYVIDSTELRDEEWFERFNIRGDAAYRFNNNQQISFSYWGVSSVKSLNPSFYNSFQNDTSHRYVASYSAIFDKHDVKVQIAYFDQVYHYQALQDTIIAINSYIATESTQANLLANFRANKRLNFNYGLKGYNNIAEVSTYAGIATQQYISGFLYLNYRLSEKIGFRIGERYEVYNQYQNKNLISFSTSWLVNNWFKTSLNIDQKYRIPTFNDRFWNPGGNPSLQPEEGWGVDWSNVIRKKFQNLEIENRLSLYSIQLDNWIKWIPGEGFWSPVSFMNVWSRGAENFFKAHYQQKSVKWLFHQDISYTKSTIQEVPEGSEKLIGKQMIYTPEWRSRTLWGLEVKNIQWSYVIDFTSSRHTTTDNNDTWALDPLVLLDLNISYSIQKEDRLISIVTSIKNLANTQYSWVEGYPMPGRYIKTGLIIKI